LINDTFVLRDVFYRTHGFAFVQFDKAGDYIIYEPRKDGKWRMPWYVIYQMWKIGAIIASPRLNHMFSTHYHNVRSQVNQGGKVIGNASF